MELRHGAAGLAYGGMAQLAEVIWLGFGFGFGSGRLGLGLKRHASFRDVQQASFRDVRR